MARFTIYRDGQGEYRWKLQADNNQVIATSGEGYKAKSDCKHAVDLIRTKASEAEIKDETSK